MKKKHKKMREREIKIEMEKTEEIKNNKNIKKKEKLM